MGLSVNREVPPTVSAFVGMNQVIVDRKSNALSCPTGRLVHFAPRERGWYSSESWTCITLALMPNATAYCKDIVTDVERVVQLSCELTVESDCEMDGWNAEEIDPAEK